jgi:Holliday junction resolvase RusA-like endonuclease
MANVIILPVPPSAKPRMTQADRWKGRKVVKKYYAFKDTLKLICAESNFILGDDIEVTFYMQIPESMSKKKQLELEGTPHQKKPDIDNLLKAVMDSLLESDSSVHTVTVKKVWSLDPRIEITNR